MPLTLSVFYVCTLVSVDDLSTILLSEDFGTDSDDSEKSIEEK